MTAPTAAWGPRAAEYLGYQLAIHPRLRGFSTVWLLTHTLCACALIAAPPAAASTLAGALNWTGITDSHNVPIGNYYLSVVSTTEAITKAGPAISANPASWTKWLANAVTTGLTHETICEALQLEAAAYIFLLAIALWLMKFAMSNTWLYWLATWFRPLFDTIRAILADLWVFPICLLAGLGVGVYHLIWHGRKGFGAGIIVSTFGVGVLGTALTRDPLSDLYNENGLITQARNLSFTAVQAAFHNGAIAAGGPQGQLQHLTGLIADATVRMPLQLMNFGEPIDNIGSCGQAYTNAMLSGHDVSDAAHAMAHCGAPQALTFAQHLSGANLALGGIYGLLGAMFAGFVCYVTYSYVMVCSAAFINALLSIVVAAPAMIHGNPRRRAVRRFTMFFKHAALVFAYTTYISTAAMILLKMAARGGYADQAGMTHPLARLVMIAITSVAAIGIFWWLKKELGDHTRHDLTHAVTDLKRQGREGYQRGQDTYNRARDLNARAPWSKTSDPSQPDTPTEPGQPLTGTPVSGRPPGGRPPGPGRASTPTPVKPTPPPAPAGAAAAGATESTTAAAAGSAGSTAAATQAAGTVVAPEVAVAVVAARAAQQHRRGAPANGQRGPAPTPSAPTAARTPAAATPAAGRPGRAAPRTAAPSPQPDPPATNSTPAYRGPAPHESNTGDQPVSGRNR